MSPRPSAPPPISPTGPWRPLRQANINRSYETDAAMGGVRRLLSIAVDCYRLLSIAIDYSYEPAAAKVGGNHGPMAGRRLAVVFLQIVPGVFPTGVVADWNRMGNETHLPGLHGRPPSNCLALEDAFQWLRLWRPILPFAPTPFPYTPFPWMMFSSRGERIIRWSSSTRLKRLPSLGVLR